VFPFFSSHLHATKGGNAAEEKRLPENQTLDNKKTWSYFAFLINAILLIAFEAANVAILLNILSNWKP
jgi:hypothetical protein